MASAREQDAVVVTGMGLITSLGLDVESTWRAMCRGECGVGPAPALESLLDVDPGAGQVKALPRDGGESAAREVDYLQRAVQEAATQAGLSPGDQVRRGFLIGTTLHGMRHGGRFLRTGDFAALRRFLAGSTLAAGAKSVGPPDISCTTCSACSSGLASVSLARSLLDAAEIDLAIAGGYDPISEYSYAGFNSMRLVSPTSVRPFAADRDGMKVAEGYAVVVLESEQAARARGVSPLAQLSGIGESCDAFHLSKPHPEGAGAAAAIRQALADADLDPSAVDLIIAHGTATLDNDAAEYAALKQVFGERLGEVPLLATKSHLGHSLGAAGAVDLIVATLALREGRIPPCANLSSEAAMVGAVNPVQGTARRTELRNVLVVSLGFGGANMAAIVAAPTPPQPEGQKRASFPRLRTDSTGRVAISGVGVVVPGGAGNDRFLALLNGGPPGVRPSTVTQEELEPLISARRTRRMSEFAKLMIAATGEALRHAGVQDPALFCEACSAIVASMHGPTEFCESFYRQIINEGPAAANPSLFAEGVPNVASAHLSTTFGIRGFCQTLIGSRTAGLDALSLAAARIRSGQWHRVIVGAAEECTPLLHEVYGHLLRGRRTDEPMAQTGGAVALLLESEESFKGRSAQPIGFVDGTISRTVSLSDPRGTRRVLREVTTFTSATEAQLCTMSQSWIGRLERRSLPRSFSANASGLAQAFGEAFAAAPLLGLAAVLLWQKIPAGSSGGRQPALGPGARVATVCADYFGGLSAARILLA